MLSGQKRDNSKSRAQKEYVYGILDRVRKKQRVNENFLTTTDKYQKIMSKYIGDKQRETTRVTNKLEELFAITSGDDP